MRGQGGSGALDSKLHPRQRLGVSDNLERPMRISKRGQSDRQRLAAAQALSIHDIALTLRVGDS